MKVFRGPSSKNFMDDTHELVSKVTPQELEKSITSGANIRFNINKDAIERKAVCTVQFEDEDIVPMISGLLSKLKVQQVTLRQIKNIMGNGTLTEKIKIESINKALAGL